MYILFGVDVIYIYYVYLLLLTYFTVMEHVVVIVFSMYQVTHYWLNILNFCCIVYMYVYYANKVCCVKFSSPKSWARHLM